MSWKLKIAIGVTVLLIITVNAYISATWNKSDQHNDYVESMGRTLTANDSSFIKKFYTDLSDIHADYLKQDRSGSYSEINVEETDQMELRILTKSLLNKVCEGKTERKPINSFSVLNKSMGTSGFIEYVYYRNWDASFRSDLDYLYAEKYFGIVELTEIYEAEMEKGASTFTSGSISGNLLIYNITTLKCVSISQVYAENNDEFEASKFTNHQSLLNELNSELRSQFNAEVKTMMRLRMYN